MTYGVLYSPVDGALRRTDICESGALRSPELQSIKSISVIVVCVILAGWGATILRPRLFGEGASSPPRGESRVPGASIVPVSAVPVRRGEMKVTIDALGTVIPVSTVLVRSRVDGELIRLHFREGQLVKAGELLAELDPRPYQAAYDQASGQLKRDEALLNVARLDARRYRELLAEDAIAAQQVEDQDWLVRQDEGIVAMDRGAVATAHVQLDYTRITSPITGRVGLRQVDVGNIVHAADAGGLVVVTTLEPITIVFSIPSETLPGVLEQLRVGHTLRVLAFDRAGKTLLATGHLLALDNQIDIATAMLKLKAEFENHDRRLFPNQFVNIKLEVDTRRDVLLIPQGAVQNGQNGTFVYTLNQADIVSLRPVVLGPSDEQASVVESGLQSDEWVITEGVDRLHEGSKVQRAAPQDTANSPSSAPPKEGREDTNGHDKAHRGGNEHGKARHGRDKAQDAAA